MKLFLAIIVIAAIAIIGSRLSFYNRRIPLGFRNVLLTGTEYIFIGVLLGRSGFDVLDAATLEALEPALLFALGWIGFLVGLQFNFKEMRKLPHSYLSITAVESFVTFLLVAAAAFWVLDRLAPFGLTARLTTALLLGATASCTSPAAMAIVAKNWKFDHVRRAGLLRYISGVDSLFGLLLFALALSVAPVAEARHAVWYETVQSFAIISAMGVAPALILIVLNRNRFRHQELILFLIGTVMFCAGLAAAANHSPLVSGLVCGIITANYCTHRTRSLTVVQHAERSIYVVLLLLIGAAWELRIDFSLVLMLAYFVVRAAGKLAGAFIGTRVFQLEFETPPYIGLGLIPEGGLAIAMVISFGVISKWPIVNTLVTVIVLSVILSELLGPRLIISLFRVRESRHG